MAVRPPAPRRLRPVEGDDHSPWSISSSVIRRGALSPASLRGVGSSLLRWSSTGASLSRGSSGSGARPGARPLDCWRATARLTSQRRDVSSARTVTSRWTSQAVKRERTDELPVVQPVPSISETDMSCPPRAAVSYRSHDLTPVRENTMMSRAIVDASSCRSVLAIGSRSLASATATRATRRSPARGGCEVRRADCGHDPVVLDGADG